MRPFRLCGARAADAAMAAGSRWPTTCTVGSVTYVTLRENACECAWTAWWLDRSADSQKVASVAVTARTVTTRAVVDTRLSGTWAVRAAAAGVVIRSLQ